MKAQERENEKNLLIAVIENAEVIMKDIENSIRRVDRTQMGHGNDLQELEWLRASEEKTLIELRSDLQWFDYMNPITDTK
jgi:hypothetical protein